jgi:hypothetical protein
MYYPAWISPYPNPASIRGYPFTQYKVDHGTPVACLGDTCFRVFGGGNPTTVMIDVPYPDPFPTWNITGEIKEWKQVGEEWVENGSISVSVVNTGENPIYFTEVPPKNWTVPIGVF